MRTTRVHPRSPLPLWHPNHLQALRTADGGPQGAKRCKDAWALAAPTRLPHEAGIEYEAVVKAR